MIPGVHAQRVPRAEGEAAFGTILDFVNGNYYVDNQQVALATLFATDITSAVSPGTGWVLNQTNYPFPAIIPAIANSLFTNKLIGGNFSLVYEFEEVPAGSGSRDFVTMYNYDGGAGAGDYRLYAYSNNNSAFYFDDRPSTDYREIAGGFGYDWPVQPIAEGIHRVGLTLTATELTMSTDGQTASTSAEPDPVNEPGAWDTVWFGSPGWDDSLYSDQTIRKIFVYDPVEASVLEALTMV